MRHDFNDDTSCFRDNVQVAQGGLLSEAHVKRGRKSVHGDNELHEKLGRNDPCPCGSEMLFKKCCLKVCKRDDLRWRSRLSLTLRWTNVY